MNWGRAARALAMFLLLITLHYTVRPLLGWRVGVDFLVLAVLLMSVRIRPGVAALLGFSTGLISDALAPTALGAGAFALTGIAFAASWLKAVFFADNVVLHAFFFFVGKWAFDVIYVLAGRGAGASELTAQLLLWSPLSAAATAVAGVFFLIVFRGALEPQPI